MKLEPGTRFRFKTWPDRWFNYPPQCGMFEVKAHSSLDWFSMVTPPHPGAYVREDDDIVPEQSPDISAALHNITKDRDALRATLTNFHGSFLSATGEVFDPQRDYQKAPIKFEEAHNKRLDKLQAWRKQLAEYNQRWQEVCDVFQKVTGEKFDPKKSYAHLRGLGAPWWDSLHKANERITEFEKLSNKPVIERQIYSVDGRRCLFVTHCGTHATAYVHPDSPVEAGTKAFIRFYTWGEDTQRVAQAVPDLLPISRDQLDAPAKDHHEATVIHRYFDGTASCQAEVNNHIIIVTNVPEEVRVGDHIAITTQNDGWKFIKRKEKPVMSDPIKRGLFMRGLRASPKYLAFLLAFSVLSSPIENYNSAKEFLTAPSVLELGEWTKVMACDTCDAVLSNDNGVKAAIAADSTIASPFICPACGGETFSTRKAQALFQPTFWDLFLETEDENPVRGYSFEDGSVVTDPGQKWLVPERVVGK